jgi:aminomethyltransferase
LGLIVDGRGIPRAKVLADGAEGEVTSGSFSPSLNVPIALARASARIGETCEVENRTRRFAARVVKPSFVYGDRAYH